MKIEQLQDLCKYWQKELRLEDIDIHVRYAVKDETSDLGSSRTHSDRTWSSIVIQPAELIGHNGFTNTDLEVTLVHELLHVSEHWDEDERWQALNKDKIFGSLYEKTIERTAQALVRLKRLGETK